MNFAVDLDIMKGRSSQKNQDSGKIFRRVDDDVLEEFPYVKAYRHGYNEKKPNAIDILHERAANILYGMPIENYLVHNEEEENPMILEDKPKKTSSEQHMEIDIPGQKAETNREKLKKEMNTLDDALARMKQYQHNVRELPENALQPSAKDAEDRLVPAHIACDKDNNELRAPIADKSDCAGNIVAKMVELQGKAVVPSVEQSRKV